AWPAVHRAIHRATRCPQADPGYPPVNPQQNGLCPHVGNRLPTGYPQLRVNRSVDARIIRTGPDPGQPSVFLPARGDDAGGMTGVAEEAQAAQAVSLCKTYGTGHATVRAL